VRTLAASLELLRRRSSSLTGGKMIETMEKIGAEGGSRIRTTLQSDFKSIRRHLT
jgi:hypothetical protein